MKYSLGKAYNGDRKEREEEMPKIAVCDDDKEAYNGDRKEREEEMPKIAVCDDDKESVMRIMAIERKGKKRCQRLQYVMMTKRASCG